MSKDFIPDNPQILYDLRQTYAMNILTPILLEIEDLRNRNLFIGWYEKLTYSLYTNIYQKLTEKEREEYQTIYDSINDILNKYPESYQGRDKDIGGIYKVKQAILKLELWLRNKMEEKGLFGKGFVYDEDEI
jgi:hypothetical protein